MSEFYLQLMDKMILAPKNKYSNKKLNAKIMSFNINKENLTRIIKNILSDFCEVHVICYEKKTNKYWCKIYNECKIYKMCALHIELEFINKDADISSVKILPIMGSDVLIEKFVSNFSESIHLYQTSSFIRSCLERDTW
jgi:hypothetical protein